MPSGWRVPARRPNPWADACADVVLVTVMGVVLAALWSGVM